MHLSFFFLPSSVICPLLVLLPNILFLLVAWPCCSQIPSPLTPRPSNPSCLPNLLISTSALNSSSSPAPSDQLSSHSLLSSLTISPNNTLTGKYFHALSILCLWQPQNELPCSAINPVSLWSSIINSRCAILFAVNQLFWVQKAWFLLTFLYSATFTPSCFSIPLLVTAFLPQPSS